MRSDEELIAVRVVLWGAGGHARVVADVVRCEGSHEVVACLDTTRSRVSETLAGAPILGDEADLIALRGSDPLGVIVAIGDCDARERVARRALELGCVLVRAIHPACTIAGDVEVGEGSVVMAGVVVNPGTKVGRNVILNTGAVVEHDCEIEDAVHLSPRACLAGGVQVGQRSWIGAGAVVIDHRRIGRDVIVGAGAVVVHDVPDGVVTFGVPARVQRTRSS